MMPLSVRIRKQRPPEVMLREWNGWIRTAYIAAGWYWVENFLMRHFQPGAAQRYQYVARSRKYLDRKRYARSMRDWKGVRRVPVRPLRPLVLFGAAEQALKKPPQAFNIRAAATSGKQYVKVPLRLPHPMNPRIAGELARSVAEEHRRLQQVIVGALQAVIKDASFQQFLSSVD